MMTGPVIRRATRDDVGSLLDLVREYWAFEGIAGFDPVQVGTALERLLGDERLGAAWIASDDDAPVGYLLAVSVFSLEHRGLTAEIDELFVREAARARGLGARLLQAAEETFAAVGCTNVSLQLGRHNDAGRAFYLARGYRPRSGFDLLEKELGGIPIRGPMTGNRAPHRDAG